MVIWALFREFVVSITCSFDTFDVLYLGRVVCCIWRDLVGVLGPSLNDFVSHVRCHRAGRYVWWWGKADLL